jgi:hypothetical protein
MTRNGIRVVDLLDDFETFVNKFTILADNHMATFPGLQVRFFTFGRTLFSYILLVLGRIFI